MFIVIFTTRFISFFGVYLVFWFLLMYCIFKPVTDATQVNNNFHWYHSLLAVIVLGFVINDVQTMISSR